jgi:mono/diheme cytochrome c family protein
MLLLLLVTACTGVIGSTATVSLMPTSTPERVFVDGDPEIGRAIFDGEKKVFAFVPCSTCHYVERHKRILLGPNMAGISKRAGSRVPGMSAVEYLRESIRFPNAYIVEGYPASTMNQAYDDRLTEENMNDVIAYLLTL